MEQGEKQVLQRQLVDFVIRDVFNAVPWDEVLKVRGKDQWEYKGRLLLPAEVASLKQEAKILQEMKIWSHYLRNDLLWVAQRLYNRAKGAEDLYFVKALQYWVSVVDARLASMESGRENEVLKP